MTGEWGLVTDADLSAPIEEVRKLYEAAVRTNPQIAHSLLDSFVSSTFFTVNNAPQERNRGIGGE